MTEIIVFLIGAFISNVIIVSIIYHFSSCHYSLVYHSEKRNMVIFLVLVLVKCAINFMDSPILNAAGSIFIAIASSLLLFTSETKSKVTRVLETIILILILIVFESIGVLIAEKVIQLLNYNLGKINNNFIMIISAFVVLILYLALICKIWNKKHILPSKYVLDLFIISFSIINTILIYLVLPKVTNEVSKTLLLISMVCVVIVDMFILNFIKYTEENNELRLNLDLLQRQSEMKYAYYIDQERRYEEVRRIFHDVNKHINVIERLYDSGEKDLALEYTKDINIILNPLIPIRYADEVILNILLNEKRKQAIDKGIEIEYYVGTIKLDFMSPIEITTIFGNLLDNAIESCEIVKNQKTFIILEIESVNEMILVSLKNSYDIKEDLKRKQMAAEKWKHQGIGLLNIKTVIQKYGGTLKIEKKDSVFYCDLFWNVIMY